MAATLITPPEPAKPVQNHAAEGTAHRLPPRHASQPHNPGQPIAAELRRQDLKIEVSPEEGLRLRKADLEAKPNEIKDRELYDRFLIFQAEHRDLFQLAFADLKSRELGLNGYDFYRRLYQGLEVVCCLNPELKGLTVPEKLGNLLRPGQENAERNRVNIELAVRIGSLSLGNHTARAGRFLDLFLAVNYTKSEEIESLAGNLANTTRLERITMAMDLVQRLYERQLERITAAADEARTLQQATAKKLVEKKEIEQRWEKLAAEVKAVNLLRLGYSLMRARAEAEEAKGKSLPGDEYLQMVSSGLDRIDWLDCVVAKVSTLPVLEAIEIFSVACRFDLLDSRLAGYPERLRDHVKSELAGMLDESRLKERFLATPSVKTTLKLFDSEQTRSFVADGYALLAGREKHEELGPESPFWAVDELQSPLTLAAVGEFLDSLKTAVTKENAVALIPTFMFSADPGRSPISFQGNLHDQQKMAIISKALTAVGPAVVPLLLSAYRSAAPELSGLGQEARLAARDFIGHVIIIHCLKDREALSSLLNDREPESPPIAQPDRVAELRPSRTARLPALGPQIISFLFQTFTKRGQEAVASLELKQEKPFGPAERLRLEIRKLTAGNASLVSVGNNSSAANRKAILAQAVRIVTLIDLVESGKPLEARTEVDQILAAAEAEGIRLAYAPALIGYVYAGKAEKATVNDLRELSAFCAGEANGPGSKIDLKRVLQTIGGQLYIAIDRDYKELDEASLAVEILLIGLIMRKVQARSARAARIISVLRGDEATWNILLELVKSQPLEAESFISSLIKKAGELADPSVPAGKLTLVRHPFDEMVLKNALESLPKLCSVSD
jgi:hypothetical protein